MPFRAIGGRVGRGAFLKQGHARQTRTAITPGLGKDGGSGGCACSDDVVSRHRKGSRMLKRSDCAERIMEKSVKGMQCGCDRHHRGTAGIK